MIPFGTVKNIGKAYGLPTLTEWITLQIYTVRNVKAIKEGMYMICVV